MTDAIEALQAGARPVLGRPLTDSEAILFAKYLNLLVKWQKTHRLVGSTKPGWIVENLFLDSLLFLRVLPERLQSVLDLGSGAGLPGLPLKIVRPEIRVVLVESRRRRASFLSEAVRELALADVRVVNARVEDAVHELASQFDAVVMRCAGRVDDVLTAGLALVRRGGIVVASGPPTERPLRAGDWVMVPGVGLRPSRRFAVLRRD